MKRLLGQSLAVLVVGTLATALTPACAENDQSIFVRAVLGPPLNRQNGQCIYTADLTQPLISEGTLDVGLRDTYEVHLLVGSQMVGRTDDKSTRVESNRVHLNGAVVRVTDPNGGEISTFTSLGSSFVDPETNNNPTYSPLILTALDAKTVAKIAAPLPDPPTAAAAFPSVLVSVYIKVFGTTLGGTDVESAEFQFPVSVCKGCLIDFKTGDDPAVKGVDCSLPLASGGTVAAPCNLGQDEAVPCQLCNQDYRYCVSRPPPPPT